MEIPEVSGPLEEPMWSYKDHPAFRAVGSPILEFSIRHFATIGADGWASDEVSLSTLSGTYFETPAHISPGGVTLDRVPLETFFQPVSILQLPEKEPRELITLEEVKAAGRNVRRGDSILFACGWESRWNTPGFVMECPNIELNAMKWLIEKRPTIIGGDVPCFDDPHDPKSPAVNALLMQGIFLIAPLRGLRAVKSKRARLVVLPLNVKSVCAFPCRAVVIED
jgi:kynurenine formamidase